MKKFEDLFKEIEENQEIKRSWEEAREEQKKLNKIRGIIAIIITILAIVIFMNMKLNIFFIVPFLIFVVFINLIVFIITSFFAKNQKEYILDFKQNIIKKIIENFYNAVEYYPTKKMPERIYREPKYKSYYNRYYSNDYIEGKINNKYYIDMAEILTEHVRRDTNNNGHSHNITRIIFHGLFAKVITEKSIMSELRIMQNQAGIYDGNNKLEMDSSEFEKYFDVITTNKIIAMQLLTPDVMEEMIEFQNRTNMKYDVVIKENEIYLRFHCGNMFEPQALKKGIINKEQLEKYFYMINFTYNLSNRLIELINEIEI